MTERQELIDRIKKLPHDRVAGVAEFVESLAQRERNGGRPNLHQALSDYAIEHAGTIADLDTALEDAATNHLLQQDSMKRKEFYWADLTPCSGSESAFNLRWSEAILAVKKSMTRLTCVARAMRVLQDWSITS